MSFIVTKKEKAVGQDMVIELSVGKGYWVIKNATEHKLALMLIECGMAEVLEKKNYGRIAKIGHVDGK